MLAALSQRTERVGLGQLVTCASYRNAGLLAKEAACIDVYSQGRLILGLGAGWFHEEYHAYGYDYRGDRQRLAALAETLEVVRSMWTEETTSFDGEYLHLDGAYCDPKPVQQLPRVLVGGGGEQVNLRIAARHADMTNWQVGLEAFVRKSGLLERYCEEAGRPFDAVVRTHGPDCRIFDTEAECLTWCDSDGGGNLWGGEPTERYLADNLVGTVDQVVEKTQAFLDAGCRGLILWLRDLPGDETLRRFMAEVVPELRVGHRAGTTAARHAAVTTSGSGPAGSRRMNQFGVDQEQDLLDHLEAQTDVEPDVLRPGGLQPGEPPLLVELSAEQPHGRSAKTHPLEGRLDAHRSDVPVRVGQIVLGQDRPHVQEPLHVGGVGTGLVHGPDPRREEVGDAVTRWRGGGHPEHAVATPDPGHPRTGQHPGEGGVHHLESDERIGGHGDDGRIVAQRPGRDARGLAGLLVPGEPEDLVLGHTRFLPGRRVPDGRLLFRQAQGGVAGTAS